MQHAVKYNKTQIDNKFIKYLIIYFRINIIIIIMIINILVYIFLF